MLQMGSQVPKFRHSLFYFRRIGEACPHAPPYPRHAVWNSEFIFQFANDSSISISIEKGQRQSEPLWVGRHRDQIQQENQQVVCLSRFRGQGFVMNNFKVDEPRPAGLLVIDHVVRSGVAVRPRPAKLIVPELMSASEFAASRFDHFARQRTPF